jgi:hypothetical protein
MNNFIEVLKKNGGVMMGRYQSNPNLCIGKGCQNTILFSATNADFKGLIEIDGENIELVNTTCFKINYEEAEIFLSASSHDYGQFTAGMANLGFLDRIDLDDVLKGLNITRAK